MICTPKVSNFWGVYQLYVPVFLNICGTFPVRALLNAQFSFILLGKFLADDLQVPSSAPKKWLK